jgi:ketosteroid isomerase-like protein
MSHYYDHTNVGDFSGALQFLSDDVVYRVPGPSGQVPYSGDWRGKTQVMLCFGAFDAAFGLVDMAETRAIAGPDEVFSINDEIFTSRGTGRPWRVGVVHHMRFDADHKICALDNYTDMAAAVQALGGQNAITVPMLTPDLVPGEQDVPAEDARAVVERFYRQFPDVDDLLDDRASALLPGDSRRLRFAGHWRGRAEFGQMSAYLGAALEVKDASPTHLLAEGGSVAVVLDLSGTFRPTARTVDSLPAVDFFQVTGDGKIGRFSRFFDTHVLTG